MRLIAFLIIITMLSISAAWFASTGGHVIIDWLGYRFESSFPVFLIIIFVLFLFFTQIFRIFMILMNLIISKKPAPKEQMIVDGKP